jgi:hypothetical protein
MDVRRPRQESQAPLAGLGELGAVDIFERGAAGSRSTSASAARPALGRELLEHAGVDASMGKLVERADVEAVEREFVERAGVDASMGDVGSAPALRPVSASSPSAPTHGRARGRRGLRAQRGRRRSAGARVHFEHAGVEALERELRHRKKWWTEEIAPRRQASRSTGEQASAERNQPGRGRTASMLTRLPRG